MPRSASRTDSAEAQSGPEVEPNCMTDDLGRESVSTIADHGPYSGLSDSGGPEPSAYQNLHHGFLFRLKTLSARSLSAFACSSAR